MPRRELVLVEPVAVLVHRREQRLEAVLVVVRRDADVVDAGAGRERMLGRVDAPRVGAVAEHVDDLVVERDLLVEREVAGEERVVDLAAAQLRDQRHELGLDLGEDARHLGRLHLRLEVVEQDVVRLVRRLEALDVAAAQLDVALEQRAGTARSPTSPSPRTQTGARLGGGARHLLAELGRHVHGLVVRRGGRARRSAASSESGSSDASTGAELVEQPPDLRVDEQLVREPLQQREVVGAVTAAGRRHDRPLVPGQQRRSARRARAGRARRALRRSSASAMRAAYPTGPKRMRGGRLLS